MRRILEELYHGNLSVDERSGPGANTPARWLKWQKLKKRYTKNFPKKITPCCEIMRWLARSWRMCPWWRISS